MKLEDFFVGKKYTYDCNKEQYVCVGMSPRTSMPIFEPCQGSHDGPFRASPSQLDNWKEYKEPVIHKVKLVWLKTKDGRIWNDTYSVDRTDEDIRSRYVHGVLKIQEVQYEEKDE